jgi:hypothetical protein
VVLNETHFPISIVDSDERLLRELLTSNDRISRAVAAGGALVAKKDLQNAII